MAKTGWIIGVAAVLAAGACDAQGQSMIGSDLMRYYPEQAWKLGLEGKAVISCAITAEGRLADCTVVSEDPPGFGFGEAAVKMSSLFKMRPRSRDGVPGGGGPSDGGRVTIPIRFKLPKDEPPPAPIPGPTPTP